MGDTEGGHRRVGLVGHCGFDSGGLRRLVERARDGVDVVMVNDEAGLREEVGRCDLLLVNRVLDGTFATSSGVELIRVLASSDEGGDCALMLVSNFDDAQAEAEAAGGLRGFGKRDVSGPEAEGLVRSALERA